jgi:hypothetical protein
MQLHTNRLAGFLWLHLWTGDKQQASGGLGLEKDEEQFSLSNTLLCGQIGDNCCI